MKTIGSLETQFGEIVAGLEKMDSRLEKVESDVVSPEEASFTLKIIAGQKIRFTFPVPLNAAQKRSTVTPIAIDMSKTGY